MSCGSAVSLSTVQTASFATNRATSGAECESSCNFCDNGDVQSVNCLAKRPGSRRSTAPPQQTPTSDSPNWRSPHCKNHRLLS